MKANITVKVRDGDVAKAIKRLRKKVELEGVISDVRRRECYTPPSQKRRVEYRRAVKRMEKVKKLFGEA